jgi:hypothetical protein
MFFFLKVPSFLFVFFFFYYSLAPTPKNKHTEPFTLYIHYGRCAFLSFF